MSLAMTSLKWGGLIILILCTCGGITLVYMMEYEGKYKGPLSGLARIGASIIGLVCLSFLAVGIVVTDSIEAMKARGTE